MNMLSSHRAKENRSIYLSTTLFFISFAPPTPYPRQDLSQTSGWGGKLFASLVSPEQIVHVRDGGNIFRVDNEI